jgi:hypothetical protein
MAQFPVDDSGMQDAVNYLLSGPAGLGQNFSGFSSYQPAYLTSNYRIPFTQSGAIAIYVAPIACSSAVKLDARTFQYNFASTQATIPFANGNTIRGSGWADPFYNGSVGAIGVVTCTLDYVIFRTQSSHPTQPDDLGGGFVFLNNNDTTMSTDCNARVTVTGATDRVFISGQLEQFISHDVSGDLNVKIQVNRYRGFLNPDPTNPDYLFLPEETIAEKEYNFSLVGSGILPIETIFSTLIDKPKYPFNQDPATPWTAYYWYILEVYYYSSDVIVYQDEFKLRSLSAQVVKQ